MVTIYIIWYKRDDESEWAYVTIPFTTYGDACNYGNATCCSYKLWRVTTQRVNVKL